MSSRVRRTESGISFQCPGCGDTHSVPVEAADRGWTWNGSLDRPTLHPSILVRAGHYAPSWKPGDECWCGKDYGFECYQCHSFLVDGQLQFCSDSSHTLAGRTVDLPDLAAE